MWDISCLCLILLLVLLLWLFFSLVPLSHCWNWWFLNITWKWTKLLQAWVSCCVWFSCFSDPSVICGVDNCIYKFEVADICSDCSFISSSSGCDSGSTYLMYNVEIIPGSIRMACSICFFSLAWPTLSHLAGVFLVLFFCLLCSVSFSVCTLHIQYLIHDVVLLRFLHFWLNMIQLGPYGCSSHYFIRGDSRGWICGWPVRCQHFL